jgi:outer membrane protein assembly factor BamE (lipoprotein component of BamABCDE complex)
MMKKMFLFILTLLFITLLGCSALVEDSYTDEEEFAALQRGMSLEDVAQIFEREHDGYIGTGVIQPYFRLGYGRSILLRFTYMGEEFDYLFQYTIVSPDGSREIFDL